MKGHALIMLFTFTLASAEETCWEVKPATQEPRRTSQTNLNIESESLLIMRNRSKIVCFDFDDPEDIIITQDGECGSNKKCASNLLILEDDAYVFTQRLEQVPNNASVVNLGSLQSQTKYNIFTEVEEAQVYLKKPNLDGSVMYAETLNSGLISLERSYGIGSTSTSPSKIFADIVEQMNSNKNLENKSAELGQFKLNSAEILQIKSKEKNVRR